MIEIRPNVMDRMVAAFSPERGLKRMAARASLAAATALTAPRGGSPTDPGAIWGRGGYKAGMQPPADARLVRPGAVGQCRHARRPATLIARARATRR
jgi:hypothetical protein